MVYCSICNNQYKSIQSLSHHIKSHKITLQEYYDLYMKKSDKEGICPVCGNKTSYRSLSEGYLVCCSSKCSNNYNIDKIKQTKLDKYGNCNYNNRDKCKETCLERYGVDNILKISEVHENGIKAAQSKESNNKRNKTNFFRYGATNVLASKSIQQKIKQTNLNKYGKEYATQNTEILNKIQETNLKRYGVVCNLNIEEVKQKAHSKEAQIKRNMSLRGKPKYSKLEKLFETKLNELGYIKNKDYFCQHKTLEYPFKCDFYLVKSNTYIEINGYWMHGFHPFNRFNKEDIKKLNQWKEKSANSEAYEHAIHIWTEADTKKRKYGQKLNFIELWNIEDIENYFDKLKEVN